VNPTDLIALLVLLALDLLFAITRAALINTRLPTLISSPEQKQPAAARTLALLERSRLRVSLRFGMALVHFILAGVVWWILQPLLPNAGFWAMLGLVFVAMLIVLCLEFLLESAILPSPETWAMRLTPVAIVMDVIFTPFTALLFWLLRAPADASLQSSALTEEDLRLWVESGQPQGGLEQGERKMIASIFEFGDTLCREVMVPRVDIVAMESNTTLEEAIQQITQFGHSRLPVYEESIDNIIGLLYAKDLLKARQTCESSVPARTYMRPAFFVPESKMVDDLLRDMQAQRVHMAVVVDEYGGTAGLVTLEDIVEEIVGEIRDEYDQLEELLFQQVGAEEFLLQARISVNDLNELLGTHQSDDLADTLGGTIYSILGHVPTEGERIELDDWVLTVEKVSGRTIRKVHAKRTTEPDLKETSA
jgi:putative hemolysin